MKKFWLLTFHIFFILIWLLLPIFVSHLCPRYPAGQTQVKLKPVLKQVPELVHVVAEQRFGTFWHLSPEKPCSHRHTDLSFSCTHVCPLQGLGLQWSVSKSNIYDNFSLVTNRYDTAFNALQINLPMHILGTMNDAPNSDSTVRSAMVGSPAAQDEARWATADSRATPLNTRYPDTTTPTP